MGGQHTHKDHWAEIAGKLEAREKGERVAEKSYLVSAQIEVKSSGAGGVARKEKLLSGQFDLFT